MNLKRITITAIIASMLVPSALPVLTGNAAENASPVLWYEFDDGAKDSSGNDLNGTVNGAVIKDGSAVFDGSDDYIKMPDGILKNADAATVAIYLRPEIEKANQFTWCIGNSSTSGYMFLNTYNPSSKLRAAITKTTYTAEEELASSEYAANNEWVSIIAVFDGANSVLYRNGEQAAVNTGMTIKPSDLGATTANYIAKSVYNDPYFKGTVSDFRIYDKALSAEEASKVAEEQKSSYAKTAPEITSVTGDGIKTHGVEIDSQNNTVFLPLKVGTDASKLAPEFICERGADIALTSGTYENGVITVTDKDDASLSKQWKITAEERGNAVLDGFYADPNIACFNGKYYIYPTTDGGSGWDAPYFKCFSSDDLVSWTDEGVILDLKDVSWSNGKNGWAPTIAEKNGKYYFYYSAAPLGNGAKNLAVAVSESPTGPFEDKGVIVEGGSLSGQMIDSAVFTDDDGQSYLYWGNGSMYGAKLSEDMLSVEKDTIKKLNPSNFREGSFMIKRDGKYYMMWSDDDTGNPNYRVYYGIMDSPLGTISGSTLILQRDNADSKLIKGTGHHSVINIPGTDEWYICYHRFNTALYGNQETQSSAAGNHREVCIDKMEFDENGNIKRVVPTVKGITEPVYAGYPVNISKAEIKDGVLSYALSANEDISDADIYTALYNSDGTMKAAAKNKTEGAFEVDTQSDYTLKVFVWKKGTMEPIGTSCAKLLVKADTKPEPVVKYDFENNSLSDINAVFKTGASLVNDTTKNSKVLYLNGTSGSYMEFAAPKDSSGGVLESYTVSFDVKNNTTGNYFNFYIGDGSSKSKATNYLGVKAADTILVSTVDSTTEKKTNLAVSGVQGSWTHFDIVVSNGTVQIYVNNQLKGELKGYMMKAVDPSVIRFGFSPWSADKASNAYYDNIEVYDCALSQEAITGIKIEPRPAESTDNDRLLFAMNFNNRDLTTVKGKASANGTITYEKSDDTTYAARLNGSGTYLSLTDADGTSLLTGKDEITITFHKKADAEKTSWWFYAAPNDNEQTYQQEHYLGILDNGEKLTAERYNNSGVRTESAEYGYTQGLWQEVTLVAGRNKSTLYIDGKQVSEKDYNFKLSDILGSNPVTYIGRANWGKGEWGYGLIDDIAVFDFAPEINLGDLSNVTSDIALPAAAEETDGYSITWKSSDESVITASGKVTLPEHGKKTAVLTAVITFGAHKLTRSFDVTVKADDYYDFNLQINNEKGVDIRQGMYGLFFEDINYSADGGLYAEMIENRSFEALKSNGKGGTTYDGLYGWSVYNTAAESGTISIKSENGLNDNNTHYLNVKSGASVKNQAYDGIYMEAGKTYNVSAFIRSASADQGCSVKAGVYKDDKLIGECVLSENADTEWKKYEASITPQETVRNADFAVTAAGDADIDMISCIPDDAVNGIFRRDLAEKLKAINPGFLRFPGGCIIEGYNIANRYNWKDTVGSVEERKQNWSRWACHTSSGLDGGFKHYNQTYGIGYYEYFLLCEYLNCDAVPVVNVGMACEYQSSETVPVFESDGKTYTEEFYRYIQDALDLVEFANGGEDTTWGKVRCDMGHPEPFNLEMIGIGNEQWVKNGNQWYERYEAFEKEIHKVYPDIKLISTSGPSASGTEFTGAWSWIRNAAKTNDKFTYAVDEHYYMDPSWFLENDGRYDNYDRNVKVFAGEYASKGNTLKNALAEAAFMTGLERNADVVYMASYAPLFARINYTQWAPDMIWFDDAASYVSPDYHVQSMYSNNNGDHTLKSTAKESEGKVYQSVSYDNETKDIIIKIVNPYDYTERAKLSIDSSFTVAGEADIITLTGKSNADTNSIENPDNIKPVSSKAVLTDGTYYNIPPRSFIVMRVHTET